MEGLMDCAEEIKGVVEDGDEDMEIAEKEFTIESTGKRSEEDVFFDNVVECLQDIVFDMKFEEMQQGFFKTYSGEFEATEENKLVYTEIFFKYKKAIEGHIEGRLRERIPEFKMPAFLRLLEKRASEIDEQLSETLISLSDFIVFKQLILEYKDRHSGKALDFCLAGTRAHLHEEEQSDGDERPDIMLDIRPLKKVP